MYCFKVIFDSSQYQDKLQTTWNENPIDAKRKSIFVKNESVESKCNIVKARTRKACGNFFCKQHKILMKFQNINIVKNINYKMKCIKSENP